MKTGEPIPMLEINNIQEPLEDSQAVEANEVSRIIDFVRLFLSRHYLVIAVSFLAMVVVGFAYIRVASPKYTASATLEIRNREAGFLHEQASVTDAPFDLQREIALIQSPAVAERTVKTLKLDEDPDFNIGGNGRVSQLRAMVSGYPFLASLLGPEPENPAVSRLSSAIATLQRNLRVDGIGIGVSIELKFTSTSAEKAARIANGVADSFIEVQNLADAEVRSKANKWLIEQSAEFRQRAEESEAAVAAYKKENNLLDVDGKSLFGDKLQDLNKLVTAARAAKLDAQYKLDKISEDVELAKTKDVMDITSGPEVLGDPTMAKLRDRYLELMNEIDSIQKNFGKDSQKLRDLVAATKNDILNELPRLRESARNDFELSSTRLDDLLNEQRLTTEAAQHASVFETRLKELQSSAANYRTLYDNFVQHAAGSVQEVSFPVRAAQIAERAAPPLERSWPKNDLVLALAGAAGLALGVALGLLRDISDPTFHTGAQLERATRLTTLGMIPLTQVSKSSLRRTALTGDVLRRIYSLDQIPIWWAVKGIPNSRFSSEMVSAGLAVRSFLRNRGARVIGVTSAVPGEGKTTFVASLAVLMAQYGYNVALIDLDLHIPALSKTFAPEGRPGLAELIAGTSTLAEVLIADPDLNLSMMTAGARTDSLRPVELLTSPALRKAIAELRRSYDCILVDLPPLVPVSDVRATADFVDGYVLAIEWAKTSSTLVARALDSYREIRSKFIGGVFNKVNFKKLEKYDSIAPSYYSKMDYGRYRDKD